MREPNDYTSEQIAAIASHDLNNIIGLLFAACSYVEEGSEDQLDTEAYSAINDACSRANVFSNALLLLAIDELELNSSQALEPSSVGFEDIDSIVDDIRSWCGVKVENKSRKFEPLIAQVDTRILRALMISAMTCLRRVASVQATFSCTVSIDHGINSNTIRNIVELRAHQEAPFFNSVSAVDIPYLADLALKRADTVLPRLGVKIDREEVGSVRILLAVPGQVGNL